MTHTGSPVAPGIGLAANQFVADFSLQPDGPLGPGWTTGKDLFPNDYEPLGILDGAVVCTDQRTRPGTYAADQDVSAPPPGELWQGISYAYRDFGTDEIYVEVVWSGLFDLPIHTECGPAINITPGSSKQLLSVWQGHVGGDLFLVVGYIGKPPELFEVIQGALIPHVNGTKRAIGIGSNGTGATLWVDGAQVNLNLDLGPDPVGLAPFPIPAELLGSTLHGFTVDTHLVDYPPSSPPPVCHAFSAVT